MRGDRATTEWPVRVVCAPYSASAAPGRQVVAYRGPEGGANLWVFPSGANARATISLLLFRFTNRQEQPHPMRKLCFLHRVEIPGGRRVGRRAHCQSSPTGRSRPLRHRPPASRRPARMRGPASYSSARPIPSTFCPVVRSCTTRRTAAALMASVLPSRFTAAPPTRLPGCTATSAPDRPSRPRSRRRCPATNAGTPWHQRLAVSGVKVRQERLCLSSPKLLEFPARCHVLIGTGRRRSKRSASVLPSGENARQVHDADVPQSVRCSAARTAAFREWIAIAILPCPAAAMEKKSVLPSVGRKPKSVLAKTRSRCDNGAHRRHDRPSVGVGEIPPARVIKTGKRS